LAKPSSHLKIWNFFPLKFPPQMDIITNRPTYISWRPFPSTPYIYMQACPSKGEKASPAVHEWLVVVVVDDDDDDVYYFYH
jgi:hypothetical protein